MAYKNKADKLAYYARRRKEHKAEGLCPDCFGKRPAEPGKICCFACAEKYRRAHEDEKLKCFAAYGGPVCVCCGEDRIDFLSLDHVNGDGEKDRRELKGDIFTKLRLRGYPKGFQVLCIGCNWGRGKRDGDGVCPHKKEHRFVVANSGVIGPTDGAINPFKQAVCLGRMPRFAGNTRKPYSVLQHSMVVADLMQEPFKLYGLLHDMTEGIVSDVPKPFKFPELKHLEDALSSRMWKSLGLDYSYEVNKAVKTADKEALHGEVWTIANEGLRVFYSERFPIAERLTLDYLEKYSVVDCSEQTGSAIVEYIRRLKEYGL